MNMYGGKLRWFQPEKVGARRAVSLLHLIIFLCCHSEERSEEESQTYYLYPASVWDTSLHSV